MPKRRWREHLPNLFAQRSTMKIISGGQTGADRGGLEAGRELGFETGGWVPKGWLTEIGPDPTLADFGCIEHISSQYPPRTKANVFSSDGTVWFGNTESPGYRCTYGAATKYQRNLRWFIENPTPQELREWVKEHNILVLNVAGNRESKNPGIRVITRQTLFESFTKVPNETILL